MTQNWPLRSLPKMRWVSSAPTQTEFLYRF
jgi:hypothetical protein